ncbi:MAG: hypothetical protein JJE51_12695 [Thermoanaerobaculia bacterium]|nr:hypothetical protein [Thermoanaerobaculia bacterium]
MASVEEASDYPLLHAQAVILLWTGLEALVRDFLATWLENVEASRTIEPLRRTKVRLGELESLSGREKYLFMIDSLEETLGSRRSAGIERFEVLFRALGMSSPIPAEVTQPLFELANVRHVLVHRRGIVDRKFAELLPQLSYRPEDELKIDHAIYHRFYDAVDLYVHELIQRTRLHFGGERSGHRRDCRFFDEDDRVKQGSD